MGIPLYGAIAVKGIGTMEQTDSFGYWVMRRRKALDLTWPELANRVSCAVETIRKIERDERLMKSFSARPALPPELFPKPNESELRVLALMAQGANNDQIAARLSFSSKTVRNYVSNIFSKLQVADRAQAIVKAREAGVGLDFAPSPAT